MTQRSAKIPPDPKVSFDENERQYRVLNQMLTAHSAKRDHFQFLSTTLKICLFCSSIMLSGFVFFDDKLFKIVGMNPDAGKLVVGFASFIVLSLSVVELLVGWERKAALHEDAAKRLAALKLRYRQASTKHQGTNVRVNEGLTREWERLNENLPLIPDHQFVRLKHRHHIKRQLSELAELNRQIPFPILVMLFYKEGIWQAIKNGVSRRSEADTGNTAIPAVVEAASPTIIKSTLPNS